MDLYHRVQIIVDTFLTFLVATLTIRPQQIVNSNGNEQTRISQCFLRTMCETLSQMYVAFDKKTIEL